MTLTFDTSTSTTVRTESCIPDCFASEARPFSLRGEAYEQTDIPSVGFVWLYEAFVVAFWAFRLDRDRWFALFASGSAVSVWPLLIRRALRTADFDHCLVIRFSRDVGRARIGQPSHNDNGQLMLESNFWSIG